MLKLFYKSLLISVLSGSLLLLSFQFDGLVFSFGANSAQAVDKTGTTAAPVEKVKTDKIDGDMISTITMLVVAIVVVRLYKCKWTTDMMIAIAGGVIFLAGEVIAAFGLSSAMKGMEVEIKRDDKGNVDQKQIETLQKLKKSYEEAKKTANFKKTLQLAAAAAFLAAAVVAGYQAITLTAEQTECLTALEAGAGTCMALASAAASTGAGAADAKSLLAGGAAHKSLAGIRAAQSAEELAEHMASNAKATKKLAEAAADKSAHGSAVELCPAGGLSFATCGKADALQVFSSGVCAIPPVALLESILSKPVYAKINYTPIKQPTGIFEFFKKTIISEARADIFSTFGIASAAVVALILTLSTTIGMQIDIYLFHPTHRAIIWGVFVGLAYAASSATSNQIKKIEDNIKKIDDILKSLNALSDGVAASNAAKPGAATDKSKAIANGPNIKDNGTSTEQFIGKNNTTFEAKPEDIDLNANGTKGAIPCATGDNISNCEKFSTKLNTNSDLSNLPQNIQGQIGTIGKLTDGLSGKSTISGDTIKLATEVAGQQNALTKILKNQQKDLQKLLDANGSKINLENEANGFAGKLQDVIKNEIKNRKTTPSAMLASINGSMGGGSGAVASDANKKAKDGLIDGMGSFVMPPMPAMPSMTTTDLKNNDPAKEEAVGAAINNTKAATMDDYDLKNDITQDKGASIFELISNRYHKSMDRLFLRKK